MKNQPVLYDSLKKKKGLWLTTETWELIEEAAAKSKVSRSEYVEQLIRQHHGR